MNAAVPEPSLTALMRLLAEQALVATGLPHPMLKEAPPADPAAARFLVDLLGVLKKSTEGNRSAEESLELDELLYHLRLRILGLDGGPADSRGV